MCVSTTKTTKKISKVENGKRVHKKSTETEEDCCLPAICKNITAILLDAQTNLKNHANTANESNLLRELLSLEQTVARNGRKKMHKEKKKWFKYSTIIL